VKNEHLGEGWVANIRLQFEGCHLAHRIFVAAEALANLGNAKLIHAEIS